ncbi:interferon alpha/beta receptor 1-like [Sceloporus undulatus]|uniref:interferon alpha/beta receptor 1-like n=1 Tax=Sceloporus undulatus TaxID=8520 RepID=UPI001C4B7E98|nr:interferon alpha/beta receptor 1-like [Sceloporus undulatus]
MLELAFASEPSQVPKPQMNNKGTCLLPPQNVTLISENFYSFLTWIPASDSTNNTQYEVERSNGSFLEWVKEASCKGNNVKQAQRCQLHLSKLTNSLFKFYQARVRAKDGSRLSEWVRSKELQLYKDSVVGPLNLFLVVADENLTVTFSLPQTPLKESDRRVIMSVLEVLIILIEEGDDNTKKITAKLRMNHTFENMKPNANYCIKATVISQPGKEAMQCIKMPRRSADNYQTPFVIASIILFGFILFGVVGGIFLKHYLYPRSSEMDFPKSLMFLKVNGSTLRSSLHLDNGSVTSLSMLVVLPSSNNVLTEQERCQIQMDTDLMPTDFNLVDNTVGFIPDDAPSTGVHQSRNLNSAPSAFEEGINQIQKSGRWNGGKESFQDDVPDNLVEDIKTILWKLAAADKLRSQTFVKADRSPQKPSKRACFWKYCVTN